MMTGGLKRRDGDRGNPRPAGTLGWIAAACLTLFFLAGAAFAAEDLRFFRIGAGSPNGSYFQIGGMLANVISKAPGTRECEHGGGCGVPGLVAVAQATQGSVDNAILISSGQLESGLVQADIAQWAFAGDAVSFKGCNGNAGAVPSLKGRALKNLRVIAALFPEHLHIVARQDKHIRKISDLAGKRVALGEAGSGTLAEARLVLSAAGIDECRMKANFGNLSQAVEAMQRGEIDAFFVMGGYPVPAVMDLASVMKINLVPIPANVAAALHRRYAGIVEAEIPGATYPGIDHATPSFAVNALWLTAEKMPDDLVYAVTGALWQDASRRILDNGHSLGRRIVQANATSNLGAVPLHPGAKRWYDEAGKQAKSKKP